MRVDNKVKFRERMGPKRHKKNSRSLTTKGIWKLIAKRGLWRQVCYRKYIFPMKFYEWI
jgi:hypothetical protein